MQNSLGVQYNEKYSLKEIQQMLLSEISHRPQFYLGFYLEGQNKDVMVEKVKKFFKDKQFASNTVDMLIGVTCNTFDFTLWVYQQNENGLMHSIQYSTGKDSQKRRHCHLILYRDRNDIHGLGNHYNSILSKKRNKGCEYEDYGAEDVHENYLREGTPQTNNEEENFIDDFDFEDLGPPDPGLVLTPTPHQTIHTMISTPHMSAQILQQKQILTNLRLQCTIQEEKGKGLVFHMPRLLILQLKTLARFHTT